MNAGPALARLAARTEARASPTAAASQLHGPRHWRDVARIGLAIAAEVPEVDRRTLFLFAALHDSQRLNDGHDPDHGHRAAMHVLADDGHGLSGLDLERLEEALCDHTSVRRHADPTIGACWDADRLTLERVEIMPEVGYMSTAPVRADLDRFLEIARTIRTGPDLDWEQIAGAYES